MNSRLRHWEQDTALIRVAIINVILCLTSLQTENMETIAFIDIETDYHSGRIRDIGGIKTDESSFHSGSVSDLIHFLQGSRYICGHNIFNHDLKYIRNNIDRLDLDDAYCIDTLFLSPLLFPARPYHALLKNDKLQSDDLNNPLSDSKKTRDLFFEEVAAFNRLDDSLKRIFYSLLKDIREFSAFFRYIGYQEASVDLEKAMRDKYYSLICERVDLSKIIMESPVELAYCLALINTGDRYSITPPWVLNNYPAVKRVMFQLRSNPCLQGCSYCNQALDVVKGLKQYFGYDSFRNYEGEPLQEKAARTAIANKSLLAVFPTGGGKSIAFQVPALMSGTNVRGLTVVISPLQSLMKDQVDNLEKIGITDAVTINGLLDPIERAHSLERVENGQASILYIAPESLRSKTIERVLLDRNVVRFVIDEAHCFSSWGQDFRVDYLYIGDFIKSLQEKKNLEDGIPVSCFTATAKPRVIEDIRNYFKNKLNLDMELYVSHMSRKNLRYQVFGEAREEDKYSTLRNLIEAKNCPTIVYVSRTRKAEELAQRLTDDGYPARPYHGQMDKDKKTENQNAFMRGDNKIMVATSAFGMGVDKKDVGMVVHYEISDSLENYIQEAGRAGRDEKINADCYILFNEDDLNKHFVLLNRTKINVQEIQQIWKAIKEITRLRSEVSQSALEIARKAGWEEDIFDIETRVKTAIAALEEAGYLNRGQNSPRIYASSIMVNNAQEAIERIVASEKFDEKQKNDATRIIKRLISSKYISRAGNEDAESRIDYLSDRLGIPKEEVIQIVNLLREERILGDAKDLTVFIKNGENQEKSLDILESYSRIEKFLLTILEDREKTINVKEINEQAEACGCKKVTPVKIKTILNFWAVKNWIKKHNEEYSKNHITIYNLQPKRMLEEKAALRLELAQFIVEYLYEKNSKEKKDNSSGEEVVKVEFSVLEIKEEFEKRPGLFKEKITLPQVEEALFYLSRIAALSIEGGFLVTYNALTIRRIEKDNKKRYKAEDYQKLEQFYRNKVQQIHIVGEYARKMLSDFRDALQFVDDYFKLNYNSFLHKYFKSRQEEIGRTITPTRFIQLFGELSP